MGGRKSMLKSSEASAGMVLEEAAVMSEGSPAGSCLIQMLAEWLEGSFLHDSSTSCLLQMLQRQGLARVPVSTVSSRITIGLQCVLIQTQPFLSESKGCPESIFEVSHTKPLLSVWDLTH